MRPRYKVSQAGVDLIEAFEGFRAKSARLDDGRWTIGYGHTRSAREGAEISREDAVILLRWVDLPPVEEAINALVSVPLTQNQYDALGAFVFNVGVDAFADSDVLAHLNAGRLTEAACALELWRKAEIAGDPVVLDALIRRRAAEKALFLAPEAGAAPTPSPLVRPRPDTRAAQFVPARRPAEIEAPLAGERAEVRLVAPYDVEPKREAATALAPEPVEQAPVALEPAAEPAPEDEAPTAWTVSDAEPAAEPETPEAAAAPLAGPTTAEPALAEEAPTAWTVETVEPEAEAALEGAAAPVATVTALHAWAAEIAEIRPEPEPSAGPVETAHQGPPEAADAALAAWTAEAANEAEPEPAPAVAEGETEAPAAEALDEAATGWTDEVIEQAAEDFEPMTPWAIELPHAASAMLEAQAPASWTPEPAEADLDEPAPSSWLVGVTRPAAAEPEPAPAEQEGPVAELETKDIGAETAVAEPEPVAAAEPEPTFAELESVVAEPAAGQQAEAVAAAESPAVVVTTPDEAPEPEEVVRELPPVGAVLQTRAVPQASARPRPLYSSYGPMAFAVAPPAPTPAESTPAAAGEGAATVAPPPEPEPAPAPPEAAPSQPSPFQGPAFQASFQQQPHFRPLPELTVPAAALEPAQPAPSFAPPVAAEAQAPSTASAPAVTAEAAPAKPLILTSPPADWEEPRAAATNPSLAAEADELETPLFDEGWDGPGALSGRIVHHEAPAEHDARATKLGVTGPYVLLGFIGFVAFGGALFAFSRGHTATGGAGNPVVLAWILALIGAACVGISVYFLLKRLGGQED